MSRVKSPASLLILTTLILVIFSLLSSPADADENGVVSWGNWGSLLQDNSHSATPLVLAQERTRRRDPLDHWSYYTGGWNISNQHYLFSVLFSGAPLFGVAVVWFVIFGIFMLVACMCLCCCSRRRYGYSRFAYGLSLFLLIVFTIAAMIGAGILYTGQSKFQGSTKNIVGYVLKQADSTADNLRNVSNYLGDAKRVGVGPITLPQEVQGGIDKVTDLIGKATKILEAAVTNKKVFHYLDLVGLILIIVSAVMLVVALLGFLLSISGLQCLVYTLVVIGWILVTLTFILCGVFLVINNAVGDTCVAMDEWVHNPTAHTALSEIIPCVNPEIAQQARSLTKDVTLHMVRLVNKLITSVSNNDNVSPNLPRALYYNQSGPLVPPLCNPYNLDKTNRTCMANEVDMSNATQVWKNYVCQVSNNGMCTTAGRLTPSMYEQIGSAVNVSYGLHRYAPFLADIVDCTFVRDAFTKIHDDHCPYLRFYSRWVYIGLATVSIAVLLSLVLWVIYARERRHRKFTKLVDSGRATPVVNKRA